MRSRPPSPLMLLKAKRAVIINSVDPWAELVASYFAEAFKKKGGTTLERLALNPDTTDFRSVFAKVKASKPDVIYAPITGTLSCKSRFWL